MLDPQTRDLQGVYMHGAVEMDVLVLSLLLIKVVRGKFILFIIKLV